MNILSIETSCDETAVSVVRAEGDFPNATYDVLGNALFSQVEIHRQYGGVFPSLAKREHAATLVPMLEKALDEAGLESKKHEPIEQDQIEKVETILEREPGLAEKLLTFCKNYDKPAVDLIAVTAGPGLEPALWVGVNFAKALSFIWNVPVVAVNHMEGHVLVSLVQDEEVGDERLKDKNGGTATPRRFNLHQINFPALSLLVSGGHTEFILVKNWNTYEKIGQTRDDAVGEAFDKVARLLGLPYPGGPEISHLAKEARQRELPTYAKLPRPMLDSGDLDFSFSGLKTAVRYAVEGKQLNKDEISALARDFEDAAVEVLIKKTTAAIDQYGIKSFILGGGVSANSYLREQLQEFCRLEYPDLKLYLPEPKLSTDNSIMIALAGHAHATEALKPEDVVTIRAKGNRSITEESL